MGADSEMTQDGINRNGCKTAVITMINVPFCTTRGHYSERSCCHVQPLAVDGMSNSFRLLIKRNKQMYKTKPNNLKAPDSFHYNGLIHCNTVVRELVTSDKV